jgi:hypothetical protein
MISIKVEENITKVLTQAQRKLTPAAKRLERDIALNTMLEVKSVIRNQTIKFAPRSAKTRSADPRILINTEEYVKGIKMSGAGADVEMDSVKMLNAEFGNKRQPARPHWRPTLEKVARTFSTSPSWTAFVKGVFGR